MSTKEDLMNSLMGNGATTILPASEDEDLFGGIPVVTISDNVNPSMDSAVPVPPTDPPPMIPEDVPPAPPVITDIPTSTATTTTTATTTASLLATSGLLVRDNGIDDGGGGGLFDDIDQQAEAAAAAAAAEEAQRQANAAAEAQLRAAEAQQAAAAAAAREEEAERIRRQQVQDQMQSIHLGGPMPPQNMSYGGGPGLQQQPFYNNGGYPQPHQQQQQQQFQQPQPQSQYNMYPPQQPNPYQQPYPPQQQQQNQMNVPPQQQDINATVKHIPNASLYQDPNNTMSQQQYHHQHQPPMNHQTNDSRYYQPSMIGSPTAGMYNGVTPRQMNHHHPPPQSNNNMHHPPVMTTTMMQPTRPLAVAPGFYNRILVTEPLLLQTSAGGLFGIGQQPHWSYQITTELNPNMAASQQQPGPGVWMVRRRFRHVVALEDRLRDDCPGAILPPRPEKHASRAIEEAGAHQSAEFAMQRAVELQNYLNLLIHHPIAQQSVVLRLFLVYQNDLGLEWPEVSNNALTRLANASVGAAVKVSESTAATKLPWQDHGNGMMDDFGEDNAELMALQNAESIRMGAVLQAVPKLEGAVTLLREQAEQTGSVGMEVGRVAKELEVTDRELSQPFDLVSAGMLRAGRRSKRLVLELSAAVQSYSNQYKLCRYERMAFSDRRNAIIRRQKERGRADHRAAQLLLHQRQQHHLATSQQYYGNNNMDRIAQDAVMMDNYATDVNQECEEIGRRLKQEVNRVAWNRKIEWNASVKVIASAMKEAVTERVAIWETVRESFLTTFPEYANAPQGDPATLNQPTHPVTQSR